MPEFALNPVVLIYPSASYLDCHDSQLAADLSILVLAGIPSVSASRLSIAISNRHARGYADVGRDEHERRD